MPNYSTCLAIVLSVLLCACSNAERDFEIAKEANTIESYTAFIEKHPNSQQSSEAAQQLTQLEYQAVQGKNDVALLQEFLSKYGDSEFATEIEQRLNGLLEKEDWRNAVSANNSEAYIRYAEQHPESNRIKVLRGTLQSSLAFSMGMFGFGGGGSSSPTVFLEMETEAGESFKQQISQQQAVEYEVVNYEDMGNGLGRIGTKRPMLNSTVILASVNDESSDKAEILAVIAGEEEPETGE